MTVDDQQFPHRQPVVGSGINPTPDHNSTPIRPPHTLPQGSVDPMVSRQGNPAPLDANRPQRSLDRFSMLNKTEALEANAIISEPLLGEVARRGQLTVIYAEPNTGKTLLMTALGLSAINEGLILSHDFYFINADDSGEGALVKGQLWQEVGAHMLVPGLAGFETQDLYEEMRKDILSGQAWGTCLVIDTAKKFVDLMNKKDASQFGKRCREYTMAGGTVVLIAHTTKNRNADGSLRYQGTTDLREDCDAMYTAELLVSKSGGGENVVKLKREKSRGPSPLTIAYAYASDPAISYEAKVASVHAIDPDELDGYVTTKEKVSDPVVMDAIVQLIKSGMTEGKMRLAKAAAKKTAVSHKAAIEILDQYDGTTTGTHLWTTTRGPRNVQVYRLLDQPKSAPEVNQFDGF